MVRPFQGRSPLSRFFLLVAALSLFSPLAAIAERYPDPPVPTGSFVFLSGNPTVNGAPLDVGDEIAAYSVHPKPGVAGKFEKVLIGHGVVTVAGQLDATPAYGDDPGTTPAVEGAVPGEEICLVLWRASEGKEYTSYLDGAGNAGKVAWTSNLATVAVDVDFVEGQRIPLRNNAWNQFAYSVLSGYDNVMPTQPQLSGVAWHGVANLGDALPLKSIAGKYDRVLGNDGSGSKFWNPALPSISSLKAMSPGYGYWIKMKADPGGLPLSWMTVAGGRTTGSESLALGAGWAQLGYWGAPIYHLPTYDALSELYPVDASDNVAIPSMGQMWSSIDTRYVRITSFDAQGAHLWNPSLPAISTLRHMGPGYGYWVKMNTAGTLTYPSRTVPSGVRAVAGDNQVTVSWLPVPGATSYNLYWGTSAGVTKASTQIPGVSSPFVHSGRTNGTPYYYIVTAVVGGVEGSASAEVSATPEAVSLAPSITTFSPSSGIAGDNVTIVGENFTVGGTTVTFDGVSATVLSNTGSVLLAAVPAGATTGAIAVTTAGGTDNSASPFTVITTPSAPTGVSAAAGINQVTLTWSASSGATSYRVYFATFPSVSKGSYMGSFDVATSPLVHSPLSAGVPYYYVVTALNRAGESADSSPVASATPFVAPPTITGFAPPSGAVGDSVTITGTNFDPVGVNDVRFNGTQAVVTSATATQIVAIVPAGFGTSGPITVTTAGGTATSSSSFTVTSSGYSISGNVSYGGSRTGRIYLNVVWNGGGETGYGVSMAGPGAFTIRGVPPGSYVVRAFRDTQGNGTQVGFSPTGTSGTVTVSGGNVSGANITLSDPGTVTPSPPTSVSAIPGNGCALVFFDAPRNGNGVEIAQSYNLYWSTSPSVSPSSFTGRKQGILAPGEHYIQRGLTNGTVLYYVATAVSGGVESAPSSVFGPLTIGAPAGGTTVSGTVSVPGVTPTGPLYVALAPQNASPLYIAFVTSPTSSQAYTVSGVQPGTYTVYAILDMNQDNVVGLGDIANTDSNAPQVTVGGSPVSGANVTLDGANAIASVQTSHNKSGAIESYSISPRVDYELKQVTNVTVTQGTYLPVPVDMGRREWEGYNVWVGSPRPNIGDNYVFTVSYSDGTSETLSALVTGVLDSFATPTYPVGTVSGASALTPTFIWNPPASPPASYTYGLWMGGPSGNIWHAWGMPSSQTSAAYNFNGEASLGSLAYGASYNWTLSVRDTNGNEAQNNVSFTVAAPLPPTVTGFSPGSGSAGDPVTITGTNFDTVPGNNTVRFAGTQATVTSATATQIVATVPAGAVSGTICVTTAGGTGCSAGSFTVIVTISFTGKVVDFARAPVSGALIERVGAPSNNTLSLADGTFVLSGIPGGTPFSLKVSKATFVPSYSASILSGSNINATATPFTLYTSAQLTGWGVTPGKGVIFGTVVDGATLAPVEGAVVTASSSLHPGTPYAVTYNTGTGFGGSATFANGIFVVHNTDDGDTVTLNATRPGWTFTPAVAASHADSATLVMVRGTAPAPPPGYSVSGTVSYSGSKTGRIYLKVKYSGGGETGLGTSVSGAGQPFTIRGVLSGSYQIVAFMDVVGTGAWTASSPAYGGGTVTVTSGDVPGVGVTLTDPAPITPQAPSGVSASPGNGCVAVFWDLPTDSNGMSGADSVNVYWSASPSVSPTSFTGSRTGILAQRDKNVLMMRGLTNGSQLYFVATATSGGLTSGASAVYGPVTVGSPAGGQTVSGTVSFTGITATGPLHLFLVPANFEGTGALYVASIASPVSPQAYSIPGVPNGDYTLYPVLDQNGNGLIDLGDILLPDDTLPIITVAGAPVTANGSLTPANAFVSATVQHGASTGGEWYNLNLDVTDLRKLPVKVAVTAGAGIHVPTDIGLSTWGSHDLWRNTPYRPNAGDNYAFLVTYSDTTSETLYASVTAVLDSFATPTFPVGSVSGSGVTTPTFTWTAPTSPPANHVYSLRVQDASNNTVWEQYALPSGTLSIQYNSDGTATVAPLASGATYYWSLTVRDPSGNEATRQASFVPTETGPVTISWTGKVTDSAGAAISGALVELVGNPARNTTTAADGTFTLPLLPSGTPFTIKAGKAGYLPVYSNPVTATFNINTTTAPFILYTQAQAAAMGLTAGKGLVLGRVLNGSSLAPVSGVVATASSASHPGTPYAVDYFNGTTYVAGSTFASGIFRAVNVDNNDVVTIAGYLSGWNFVASTFSVRADAVTEVAVFGTPSGTPPVAYTVSGTVSYGGSAPGRIYISLMNSPGGDESGYGTSIAGPGAYSIRGVRPGSYDVVAWKDSLGSGARNYSNPTGYGTLTVSSSNVPGINLSVTDWGSYSPLPPTWIEATPSDGSALVFFDTPVDPDDVYEEVATSYNLYWHTSSLVSPTNFLGSRIGIPAQKDGNFLHTGLTNGTTLYYVVTASAHGFTSAPSPVSGPVAIGAPAGGHSVSGTVSFSGVTPTGPLYVVVGNETTGYRLARYASPVNPQTFTVSGFPDGSYQVYPLVDMNNSNTLDRGDLRVNDKLVVANIVTIAGADVGGVKVTFGGESATPMASSSLNRMQGSSDWFNVLIGVDDMRKVVAKVTVIAGPNVPLPIDLGRKEWGEHRAWVNTPRPSDGDTYVFDVTYDDGTTQTLMSSITAVLDGFPNPTFPVGNVSGGGVLTPTFTWSAPSPTPSSPYVYEIWFNGPPGESWSPDSIPSSQRSVAYNSDGSASQASLTFGTTYSWTISARDAYGNQALYHTSFTPVSGSTPGIPDAPSQLTGVGVDGSVKLRWFNNAGGFPFYLVYRGGTPLGTTQSTSFTDNGVVNGTTYTYTVTAVTEYGESAPSNQVAVTPQANSYAARFGYVERRPGGVFRYYIGMYDPSTGDGVPVGNLDPSTTTVTGPAGSAPIGTRNKWVANFAPLNADGTPRDDTGHWGTLTPAGGVLPTGFYVVRAADTLGRNHVWTAWFDNSIVNPGVVDNNSMTATYTLGGGLQLSWSKQAGLSTANYPGGRVVYKAVAYTKTDHNGDTFGDEVYISADIPISDGQSAYTHTIDNSSLTYFKGYLGGFPISEFYWQVETRVNANGSEVYRANSGIKDLPGSQVVDKFVQLRKEADGQQVYHVWAQVSRPFGVPMTLSEFSSISLVDNTTGSPVPVAAGTTIFSYSPYFFTDTNSPGSVTSNVMAGAIAHLSTPVGMLPAGNYTIWLTDTSANVYTSTVNYPGDEVMPAVDNATMLETPNPDGSVTLSWLTPAGMDVTMQYRVVVTSNTADRTGDGQRDDLLYARAYFLSPGAMNTLVVPSSMVSAWKAAYASGELRWHVQTRKNNSAGMNYSRTFSGTKVFPLP